MKKIAITNIVALNGGDAAILLGMIKALKLHFGENTKITAFSTYPTICNKLYPNIEWRETLGQIADKTPYNRIRYFGKILRLIKRFYFYFVSFLYGKGCKFSKIMLSKSVAESLQIYADADYIISTGGTYLIEHYGIQSQYIDYRISLLLNPNLIFYTQSMGPFFRPDTKTKLSRIFAKSKYMFFRDIQSYNNCLSLHLKNLPYMYIVPDAAFAIGDKNDISSTNREIIGTKKKIAISVRKWNNFDGHSANDVMTHYRQSIAGTVMKMIDQGFEVYFISTCQGIDYYDNDNEEVKAILNFIPPKYLQQIITTTRYLSISEIRETLKEMDFIIATRLHMCILSLITGVPTFPIAYEFKTAELFNSLGYTSVLWMEDLINTSLYSHISEFMKVYDQKYRQSVNASIKSFIDESINVPHLIQL